MKSFAFVFPGQGSQSVGMLDAWGDHPAVLATLREASDALGEDIGRLIHEGPKEQLDLTTNTQPVMLVAGVAAWRVWRAEGGALPAAVAGHSLGEYSALVASGVLTLAQAAPLYLLDEPLSHLDLNHQMAVLELFAGLDARAVQQLHGHLEVRDGVYDQIGYRLSDHRQMRASLVIEIVIVALLLMEVGISLYNLVSEVK